MVHGGKRRHTFLNHLKSCGKSSSDFDSDVGNAYYSFQPFSGASVWRTSLPGSFPTSKSMAVTSWDCGDVRENASLSTDPRAPHSKEAQASGITSFSLPGSVSFPVSVSGRRNKQEGLVSGKYLILELPSRPPLEPWNGVWALFY